METIQITTKYRPINFSEVLGNEKAVKALADAVSGALPPHVYLLSGMTGCGKTTLARIIAREFNSSILEIDAATNSGIEDMRQLAEMSVYKPITGESSKMYIIDEIQNLSPKAFQPLLKLSEGLPEFVYMAFCTTDLHKVPAALQNRCYHVALKPLKAKEIEELIGMVAEIEKWEVDNDVFNAIVQASGGSARLALSVLQAGHGCKSRDELSEIIAQVESENSPVVKLCQYLIKGGKDWPQISRMLEQIEDPEEGISHACSYLTKAMTRSEDKQAHDIWLIIQCLSENRAIWDRRIQLYAGIGKYLFGRGIEEPF
jgi:DNA polymerase III gamma/tau subunit